MAKKRDADGLDPRQREMVEKAIEHLRTLVYGARMEMLLEAARYLVANFFDGSFEKALAQRGDKELSLRALALRAGEFGLTSMAVHKAVPVMVQHQQLGARIGDRLLFTHHVVLLTVGDHRVKKVLAESAIVERWSVVQLRAKVRELQDRHPGGRPPAPVVAGFVDSVLRQMASRDVLARMDEGLSELQPDEVSGLLDRIDKAQRSLERMEKVVRRRLGKKPKPRRPGR
jgi:hypothetical protein